MNSLLEEHRQALDATERIDPAQVDMSTPCEGFDVRGLLNYVVSNLWVEPLVSGKTIDEVGDKYDAGTQTRLRALPGRGASV